LISAGGDVVHARFRDLASLLGRNDVIVMNDSATVPAALSAWREDGSERELHLSTRLPADLFVVEITHGGIEPFERLRLPGEGRVQIFTRYRDSTRLWIARLWLPAALHTYLTRYGRPIRYRHLVGDWPLARFQNVFASRPGSAEMPSAGRPFTRTLLANLKNYGIETVFITLHAGVSSPERSEPPYEEWYNVPVETAEIVRRTQRRGGRIIAVGTTAVRALESSLDERGRIVASRGWTDLVISPERGLQVVSGLLTGFHEPASSHLAMLEAIAGRDNVRRAYSTALAGGYLWHEFGDSHLLFSSGVQTLRRAA
jgi:S-adenosylmethionine:tRNA ribosyltransferase-isomerase